MPRTGALFRRAERVRKMAALARDIDASTGDGQRAEVLRTAIREAAAAGGALPEIELTAHLPDSEAQAARGGMWYSGPSMPAYQTPAHVGIRGRLGVAEDDSELLDYGKYVPAAR
jgi:hypothetical protein